MSALLALADGGKITPADATELARQTPILRTGAMADVAQVLTRLPATDRQLLPGVIDAIWTRVNLLARDGKPAYAGLVDQPATPTILPSEARSLAQIVEAIASATPSDPRLPVVRAGLLGLAGQRGLGHDQRHRGRTRGARRVVAGAFQTGPGGDRPARPPGRRDARSDTSAVAGAHPSCRS